MNRLALMNLKNKYPGKVPSNVDNYFGEHDDSFPFKQQNPQVAQAMGSPIPQKPATNVSGYLGEVQAGSSPTYNDLLYRTSANTNPEANSLIGNTMTRQPGANQRQPGNLPAAGVGINPLFNNPKAPVMVPNKKPQMSTEEDIGQFTRPIQQPAKPSKKPIDPSQFFK